MKPTNPMHMTRANDPETSRDSAVKVARRTTGQKWQLLLAYHANPDGLTDDEAGALTGLASKPKCCYWKRCSELEDEGYLMRTLFTRPGSTGHHMMVRAITDKGIKEVENR